MNKTKAKLEAIIPVSIWDDEPTKPTDKVQLEFKGEITYEDWLIFEENRAYLNLCTGQENDMGDYMLALITWAIHKGYEDRTGKPFTLRMDRPKN